MKKPVVRWTTGFFWYDTKGTWDAVHAQAKDLDELIDAFNDEVGILKTL